MERLAFNVQINAPVEIVFKKMLDAETYSQWTAAFSPSSAYEGHWEQGSKIMFTACNQAGKREGMIGIVEEYVPNHFVSIRFTGVLDGEDEITEGDVVQSFIGNYENYHFESQGSETSLKVEVDVDDTYRSYMLETYPRALNQLKQIAENHEKV
jgi:uncharacterized protein YndB with AHSA1/START domain